MMLEIRKRLLRQDFSGHGFGQRFMMPIFSLNIWRCCFRGGKKDGAEVVERGPERGIAILTCSPDFKSEDSKARRTDSAAALLFGLTLQRALLASESDAPSTFVLSLRVSPGDFVYSNRTEARCGLKVRGLRPTPEWSSPRHRAY